MESGFIASCDADIARFKRHVTIAKMSRARNLGKLKLRKIPDDLFSRFADDDFGDEVFGSVQLLSMAKPGEC